MAGHACGAGLAGRRAGLGGRAARCGGHGPDGRIARLAGGPGNPAYVTNSYSGTVTPIVATTNTAGPPIKTGNFPNAIAITPDGETAYVVNYGSGTVTPIATATNIAGPPITVGRGPEAIVITPATVSRAPALTSSPLRRLPTGHGSPSR
jgi:YVTN family beta-propeller protein